MMVVGNVLLTPTDGLFKCFHDDDVYSWFPLCPVINMLKAPPPPPAPPPTAIIKIWSTSAVQQITHAHSELLGF